MKTFTRQHGSRPTSTPLPPGEGASFFEKTKKRDGEGKNMMALTRPFDFLKKTSPKGRGVKGRSGRLRRVFDDAPSPSRQCQVRHRRGRLDAAYSDRGFTLMEMMVTVAVLALMIGAFGAILTEAQDLVVTSQAIMKANARATALAGIIRDDISRASKLGFLHIEEVTASNGTTQSRMFIGMPGACKSVTSWETGTGSILAYGIVFKGTATKGSIYRGNWLFVDADYSPATNAPLDVFLDGTTSPDFTVLQTAETTQLDGNPSNNSSKTDYVVQMRSEVNALNFDNVDAVVDLNDVNNLWPLLAQDCKTLKIEALDDSLGVISLGAVNGGGKSWTKANAAWPAAIKVTMTLTDPELLDRAGEATEFKYEVICPVRP